MTQLFVLVIFGKKWIRLYVCCFLFLWFVQAIDETVEDFTGNINATFLEPYYYGSEINTLFDMGRPVTSGILINCNFSNQVAWFKIKEIQGRNGKTLDYAKVNWQGMDHPDNTQLVLDPSPISMEDGLGDLNRIGYADIGGLGDQLLQIRELIELPIRYHQSHFISFFFAKWWWFFIFFSIALHPLIIAIPLLCFSRRTPLCFFFLFNKRHPKLFTKIGVRPPKGVLMHGPPGTGKTLIAKAVANETGCTFRCIAGPEVMSGKSGEAEKKIRSFFEEARENAPAIIFIDEIDSIAPNREKTQDETLRRMVATLLTEMDGMDNDAHIMVIGATNRPSKKMPCVCGGVGAGVLVLFFFSTNFSYFFCHTKLHRCLGPCLAACWTF